MNIQYYGDYCFKMTMKPNGRATEDIVLVTDMPAKETGLRAPQGEVHIVLFSHQSEDEVGVAMRKGGPVILSTPGEYTARGITALGFPSFQDNKQGALRGVNTIFLFEAEEIRIAFLGALGHIPEPEIMDQLSGVDILFIPAGGKDTLSLPEVEDIVHKIEPRVVIPMHYKIAGMTTTLPDKDAFCKAVGNCPKETLPKWNVKAKDLEGKHMEVVLLERN